jgi:hypothetical protein
VADRDDITPGEDPGETTERRDWDLPPADEPGDDAPTAVPHGLTDPRPEPPLDRPAHDDADAAAPAADESERRDWDMP